MRFSLEDWAARAGALRLTKGGRIVAPKTELLTRVLAHKRVREVCVGSEQDLRLGDRLGPAEFRSLLRDLGFFLELSGYDEDEIDGQGKGDGKGKQQQRPERRERPIDPDSPFAKLAALKEDMKKGD